MTFEQIQIFISAASTLNFTETAEVFHTTQPTVSRQIHWLEEEWGMELFERVKKKIFLTPEGTIMRNKCELICQIMDNSLREARNIKNGYRGSLKIGFLESIDENDLMDLMEQFERQYPNIKVQIEKGSFGQIRDSLEKGKTDLIFTLDFEERLLQNAVSETFRREKAVFAISSRHPLFAKESLEYQDFAGIEFVFPNTLDSPGREETLLSFFRNLNLQGNQITMVPNLKTVLYYVRSGKAAALLDTSIEEIKSGEYRIVELPPEKVPGVNIVAFWKRDNLNPCIPLLYNSELFRQ